MTTRQEFGITLVEGQRDILMRQLQRLAFRRKQHYVIGALTEVNLLLSHLRAGGLDRVEFKRVMDFALQAEQEADALLNADLYLDVEIDEAAWQLWKRDRRWILNIPPKVLIQPGARQRFLCYAQYVLEHYYGETPCT